MSKRFAMVTEEDQNQLYLVDWGDNSGKDIIELYYEGITVS